MDGETPSDIQRRYFQEQAVLFAQAHGPNLWKSFCQSYSLQMPLDDLVVAAFDAGLRTGFEAALQCVHALGEAEAVSAEEPSILGRSSIILP